MNTYCYPTLILSMSIFDKDLVEGNEEWERKLYTRDLINRMNKIANEQNKKSSRGKASYLIIPPTFFDCYFTKK